MVLPRHATAESVQAAAALDARLLAACSTLQTQTALAVGFSGGLDSTVLLHVLHRLQQQGLCQASLRAVHIHHGLQPGADHWQQHCADICAAWHLPFVAQQVQVPRASGRGLEAAAREVRYAAFATLLATGEALVLAQHADDQAETVLLNLLRGSGAAGLAAMPMQRAFANRTLLRPLLHLTRAELLAYAELHGLRWLEDPSNANTAFDRNYLRQQVMPLLQQRWPASTTSLSRSATLLADANSVLAEVVQADLVSLQLAFANRLPLAVLTQFSMARQRLLVQHWLQSQLLALAGQGCTYQEWLRCWQQLVATDSSAYRALPVAAAQLIVHCWRQCLYVLPPLPAPPSALRWQPAAQTKLPLPCGELHWLDSTAMANELAELHVAFAKPGLRVRKADGHHQSLQHYYQQQGIPPWLRPSVPLLFWQEELVAIGADVVPNSSLQQRGASAQTLLWQRPLLLCGW